MGTTKAKDPRKEKKGVAKQKRDKDFILLYLTRIASSLEYESMMRPAVVVLGDEKIWGCLADDDGVDVFVGRDVRLFRSEEEQEVSSASNKSPVLCIRLLYRTNIFQAPDEFSVLCYDSFSTTFCTIPRL